MIKRVSNHSGYQRYKSDCPQNTFVRNLTAFVTEHIIQKLNFKIKIVSEHKADVNYPVVSAASIIAKVERDLAIINLQKKHGNIGCGYPHDLCTRNFLRNWLKQNGSYPDFVRKSWKTSKIIKMQTDKEQTKLY